jgi:hypothetical protein
MVICISAKLKCGGGLALRLNAYRVWATCNMLLRLLWNTANRFENEVSAECSETGSESFPILGHGLLFTPMLHWM